MSKWQYHVEKYSFKELVKPGYLNSLGEEGWELPEPRTIRRYSGQFRVRLPESLHGWLVEAAEAEGVSLNTFVVAKLSEARGVLGRVTGSKILSEAS